jgi:hypothetical protein
MSAIRRPVCDKRGICERLAQFEISLFSPLRAFFYTNSISLCSGLTFALSLIRVQVLLTVKLTVKAVAFAHFRANEVYKV